MKKGLLTVLLASLVLVGCQNYDDQFDDLNAQISALKSQVDGLSSLSGQVASLSGSISGLQAGVSAAQAAAAAAEAAGNAATTAATAAGTAATAAGTEASAATAAANAATTAANAITATDLSGLEASLASLAADVAAVQASLATAATASAVAALQAEIDAIEADVDELLATSNVYTKNLSVTSSSELDAAVALGNNINIVNGTVTFTVSNAMDIAKVQQVLNKIFTVTSTFNYTASTSDVTAVTFGKLASTGDLTVKQAGDYDFPALVTAGTITLDDAYQSKVTSIEFPVLTSVTAFQTDSSSNLDAITFGTSVTNVDLSGLTYYTNASLSVTTKKGGTVDISNLNDTTSAGVETDYTLTLNGPGSFSLSNWTSYEGALNLTNVASATVTGFKGLITLNDGVETVNFTDVERIAGLDTSSNLKSVTIDLDKVSDPDLGSAAKLPQGYGAGATGRSGTGIGFNPDSAALVSVNLTGFWQDVTLNGHANLETVDIDATMRDLDLTNNDNLTSLDVTGAEISDVTLDGNDGLTSAVLDHTSELNFVGVATDRTSTDLVVTDNLALTSLTSKANKVLVLTVTGNDALTTVDFTGLTATGASTETPNIDIYDNDLTASAASDTDDGTTQYNAATAAATNTTAKKDLGSYTSSSGMKTLATFLGAVYSNTNSDAKVHFDTVTLHTIAAGAVMSGKTAGEQNTGNAVTWATVGEATITSVVNITKGSASDAAGFKAAIAEKAGYLITTTAGAGGSNATLQMSYGGTAIFDTTVNGVGTAVILQGVNKDLDVAALETAVNVQRATALGITIDAKRGGNSTMTATIRDIVEGTTTAVVGERYTTTTAVTAANTATNYGFGTDDYLTVKLGNNSVTATAASAVSMSAAIYAAWNAKYGASGTASASAEATLASPDNTSNAAALTWTMLRTDSAGYGQALTITPSAGTVTATSGANIDYTIGSSNNTTDNSSVDGSIILTIASTDTTGATPLSAITSAVNADASVTVETLSTRYRTNTTWATANLRDDQAQNRADVRAAESSVDAAASNAVARSVQWRAHWL